MKRFKPCQQFWNITSVSKTLNGAQKKMFVGWWLIAGVTNGKIGPVANQNYEILNCTIFVILICSRTSTQCLYTKHSLIIINLHMHEQQAYKFVKFSDIDEKWHCCTPDSSEPNPSIQKLLMYGELSWKGLTVYGIKNSTGGWGLCRKWTNNLHIFFLF